jgi:CHAT domain-containing protein
VPAGGDLVVVANGALARVPFAALVPGAAGEPLGTRYALRYAPSLTALAMVETRRAGPDGPGAPFGPALVVGDPDMPALPLARGAALEPLPGAAREARWVAARLGATALTGAAASETAVLARLPNAALVHLATHGYAFGSDARARDSFVALAPDSVSDGLLTVGTLLDDAGPRLRADLVVLSGCQTGLGAVRHAEGTVGLARAFLARGARSVLVSQWNVSDEATALLMQRFYTHWLGAPAAGKAEALRRAQDDVRRVRRYAHPRYWGGFQLVGAR